MTDQEKSDHEKIQADLHKSGRHATDIKVRLKHGYGCVYEARHGEDKVTFYVVAGDDVVGFQPKFWENGNVLRFVLSRHDHTAKPESNAVEQDDVPTIHLKRECQEKEDERERSFHPIGTFQKLPKCAFPLPDHDPWGESDEGFGGTKTDLVASTKWEKHEPREVEREIPVRADAVSVSENGLLCLNS